jgi:hypothetical protein
MMPMFLILLISLTFAIVRPFILSSALLAALKPNDFTLRDRSSQHKIFAKLRARCGKAPGRARGMLFRLNEREIGIRRNFCEDLWFHSDCGSNCANPGRVF